MNNWYIEIADCTPEQRAIVERVYGAGRRCLNNLVDCKWTANYNKGEKITPDEAFAILGLDKLLEPESKPLGIDWDKLADGTATAVVQWKHKLIPVKDGFFFLKNIWKLDLTPEQNRIIATRPKPKYTPEQLEAVKAFAEWMEDNHFDNGGLIDMWLKEQES